LSIELALGRCPSLFVGRHRRCPPRFCAASAARSHPGRVCQAKLSTSRATRANTGGGARRGKLVPC
jgi:hypothetical protein